MIVVNSVAKEIILDPISSINTEIITPKNISETPRIVTIYPEYFLLICYLFIFIFYNLIYHKIYYLSNKKAQPFSCALFFIVRSFV